MQRPAFNSGNEDGEPLPDCEWIAPGVYCELAISNRRFWRCDLPARGIVGLIDPATGQRYCVEEESLREERMKNS